MSVYNNQTTLSGRVAREAVIKEIEAGTVSSFALAVYRSGKGEQATTDFLNINCWHDLARGSGELKKGDKIIVAGSISTRSYEKDGEKKYITEIQAREIGKDIGIAKEEDNGEASEEDPF